MRVPMEWLREWIDVPVSVPELSEQLTMSGLEVEELIQTGPDLSGICVGFVQTREPHPAADRLSVCTVDVGADEPLTIVCGAPNVAAKQKVAVAIPGMRLPDGTKLKKTKIRGVVSRGMICSQRELELGGEHDGILVLDTDVPAGTPLDQVENLDTGDTILDVAILANRGDCTSMLGMAREVRAHYGGEIRLPECQPSEGDRATGDDIAVEIEDGEGCFRYDARVVRDIRVGPSPEWAQHKLEAMGLRPINNVVDASNLVMMEFGQPLHAFDLDRVRGGLIRVRSAEDGESIDTLDGTSRQLVPGDVVIADAEGAVAVGGVMGGSRSEVREETRHILLESAHFHPSRVRRTAKRLGLNSDASYRFERGVDRDGIRRAVDRAARLIAEWSGGRVSQGVVTALGTPAPAPDPVVLETARLNRLLGTDLSTPAIQAYLGRLGIESETFSVGEEEGAALRCRIPSHRNDMGVHQDLIEEVARLHGFDQIPMTEPSLRLGVGSRPASWRISDWARDSLASEGLVEILSFPFVEAADLDRLRLEPDDPRRKTVTVMNPLVESQSQLRSTMLPSLLRVARANFHHQVEVVNLFEVSRVFRYRKPGVLPHEILRVTALITRSSEAGLWDRDHAPLFFDAKGIGERLCARLGHQATFRAGASEPYLHPGAAGSFMIGNRVFGSVGQLHPAVAAEFEIPVPCAVIDVDLSVVADQPTIESQYREVSRHPRVRRDLAVLLDRDQPAGEIVEAIRKQGGAHLVGVDIFDRYDGKGVPDGKVSVAFRLVFQRADRTLTDGEVTKATDKVVQMLAHRFGGELR